MTHIYLWIGWAVLALALISDYIEGEEPHIVTGILYAVAVVLFITHWYTYL